MKRILEQGSWSDDQVQYPNYYDISTPELTNKHSTAAFQFILDSFYQGANTLPVSIEYTLEDYKSKILDPPWLKRTIDWQGGDDPNTTDVHKQRAWAHFNGEKHGIEASRQQFNEALVAFQNEDGEALLEFLKSYDNGGIYFKVINLCDEFVSPTVEADDDWEEIDVDEDQEGK